LRKIISWVPKSFLIDLSINPLSASALKGMKDRKKLSRLFLTGKKSYDAM
jgi:hypothetical protein